MPDSRARALFLLILLSALIPLQQKAQTLVPQPEAIPLLRQLESEGSTTAAMSLDFPDASAPRNCAQPALEAAVRAQDPAAWQMRMNQIDRLARKYMDEAVLNERGAMVVTIPVHVVVVHKPSESVGSGRNISTAQIQTQLDVLNEDYNALNSDLGSVPGIFAGDIGNVQFQFCLADTDPSGNATTGITRYSYNSNSLSTSTIDNTVKPATTWDRNRYLNLYSVSISGGILGYAYFPGISPAYLDGAVVTYTAFGTIGTASAPFDLGRTATHEVGHYFGLRHIWGDGGCSVDDGIADTPVSDGPNYGCPGTTSSCGSTDMSMNYMDYVNDACMYMFSEGQANYMNGVINTTRSGLLTSNGCSGGGPGGTCDVPGGLFASSITAADAVLNWSPVSSASSYNVRARRVGTTTWATGSTTGTSIGFTGLTACTDYEFQIQSVCSGSSSSYSASNVFTSGGCTSSCPVPSGLFASAIAPDEATLNWSAVSGAGSYNVRARRVGTSTWATGSTSGTSIGFVGLTACLDYEFQVEADCGSSSSGYSSSSIFTSGGCGGGSVCGSYCASSASNTVDEWIGSVTIAGATSTTGDNGGYYDGTSSTLTTISGGSSYSLSLTPVWAGTIYNEYFRVWIDYNQDGDFSDAGELVFDQGAASSASPVTGSFTVPTVSNGTTGLRVSMRYNTAPGACSSWTYGEVEDYCVNLVAGTGGTCSVPSSPNATVNSSTSVTLSWNAVSGATGYTLQGRRAGTTAWRTFNLTSTVNTFSVAAGQNYEWRVRADCGGSSSAYTSIQTFSTPFLRDREAESFILTYPNPSSGRINVEYTSGLSAEVTYRVVDAMGRVIELGAASVVPGVNTWKLDAHSWDNGLYILEVEENNGRSRHLIQVLH